jgi:hypothetical protein
MLGDHIAGIVVKSGPLPAAGTWGSKAATLTTDSGSYSVQVNCGSNSLHDGWIDQVYLATQASGVYY